MKVTGCSKKRKERLMISHTRGDLEFICNFVSGLDIPTVHLELTYFQTLWG